MKWQPIDTAPKDGQRVLGYIPHQGYSFIVDIDRVTVMWFDPDCGRFGGDWREVAHGWVEDDRLSPSHWMPLPDGALETPE